MVVAAWRSGASVCMRVWVRVRVRVDCLFGEHLKGQIERLIVPEKYRW